MSNTILTQLQKRFSESLSQLFNKEFAKKTVLFLTSSSDEGVIRNFGRNGARYAPKALLNTLKKFSLTEELSDVKCIELEVSDAQKEQIHFEEAQILEADKIKSLLKLHPNSSIFHIGGGHDHIFSLLKAIAENSSKILVINIDAHADTRIDSRANSGTPFRQFSTEFNGEFLLYQIGLNSFANSFSTLSSLKNHEMKILWQKDCFSIEKVNQYFDEIRSKVDSTTKVIFSIDADAINATEMPGVSALNPTGISLSILKSLYQEYLGLNFLHRPIVGIYELNPVFDSLSGQSMRVMSSFIFDALVSK